ncbi:hypothetical protein PMIN06_013109 [Paraphaeosphaeria minitans]|uniref:Uncharacterized protein n=1 Tax=Paraphaeosphaeria minitans TaxID=565426 RepID=A0A9P6GN66_9PLEO|nr:hypothetical protein PMIN01_04943 [Paraphaeosphaeria minitans]
MEHYVSRGCQTDIQGLCHDPAPRPQPLVSPQPAANTATANNIIGTPTPPDDMSLEKTRFLVHDLEVTSESTPDHPLHASQTDQLHSPNHTDNYTPSTMPPSMLLKRKTRPSLVARISLPDPHSAFDSENPRSPPPTEALMSPLPAANTLHAGHTPIIPRALSPLPPSSGHPSPGDAGLTGPLTLPPQPGDGAADTIPLHMLDAELEKLRLAQERSASQRSHSAEPEEEAHEDDAAPPAARTKENRRTSSAEEVVDGVLLKKPRMNMGAPLGQA